MKTSQQFTRRNVLSGVGLAGVAALAPGLSGCGGSGQEEAERTSSLQVPDDLKKSAKQLRGKNLRTLSQEQYFEEANKAIDRAIKEFSRQTNTKIKNAGINADEGNFIAKQDAAVKAGNVQDLAFVTAGRFIAQLHQLDDIVDVTDVVEELSQTYGKPSGVAETLLKVDGKWWGIPFYNIGTSWFSRKDWLDEKGIKKSDFETFEELREVALEISDPKKNRFGWGLTVNRGGDANGLIQQLIQAHGGAICDDEGRKVIFNSPESVDGIQYLADIYTKSKYEKMLPPGVMSWTDTGNNEAWLAGVTGFTSNQYSLYVESKVNENPVYETTLPISGFTGPATDVPIQTPDLTAFVVFKGANNPDLAKLLAQFLLAGDPFLALAKDSQGLTFPAWDKVWESDPYYRKGDKIFSQMHHEVVEQDYPITTSTGLNFPQKPSGGRDAVLQAYILTDMMGEIIQKKVPVKKAVETAHNRMVKAFEQQGLTQ